MQFSQDVGLHQESVIIHKILPGQHRLSQQLDCRVTFQAPTVSAKNSAEKSKNVHCRTPDAGRLMANTTWMTDLPTVEQQAVPTRLGPHMGEVEDLIINQEYEELGQTQGQVQANSQTGPLST